MANPSPEAVRKIRDRVTNWSRSDADILADLNATSIDNPVSQSQVRKPLTVADAMACVSDESTVKVYDRESILVAFRNDLTSGNLSGALGWLGIAKLAGDVTESEYNAVLKAAMTKIPDPAYQPKLAWSAVTLGRLLDLEDVAAARPEGK